MDFQIYAIGLFVLYGLLKLGGSYFNIPALETISWVTAVVVLVASIYGCCVVQSENPKLVFLYAGFILAAIGLQIAIPVAFYKEVGDIPRHLFKNEVKNFISLKPDIQNAIQKVQQDVRSLLLASFFGLAFESE